MNTQIFVAYLGGIIMLLSPCILPVLPLVLSGGGPMRAARLGLGLVLSFTGVGLVFVGFAQALPFEREALRMISGVMLIGFAAFMLHPGLKSKISGLMGLAAELGSSVDQRVLSRQSASPLGAVWDIALGATLGLAWSPCVGPLLGAVTSASLVSSADWVSAGAILAAFSLGSATALVALATLTTEGLKKFRSQLIKRSWLVEKGFGIALSLTGVMILTGVDQWLVKQVLDYLPESWLILITTI